MGDNLDWQGVCVWMWLYCVMGCRKEAVALEGGEPFGARKLSLFHLSYRHGGVLYRSLTRAQLASFATGDVVYITPCPCKNDRTGLKYANHPVPAAWHAMRPINFAREMVKYEIMRDVPHGDMQRKRSEPVVPGPAGRSWTKTALDGFSKTCIAVVVTPDRATQLSIHSFRVWLACALLEAGATPEQIMLMLRWSSGAARRLYARVGDGAQVTLHEAAAEASIDSIRSHTLFALERVRGNGAGESAGGDADTAQAAEAINAAQAAAARSANCRRAARQSGATANSRRSF